MQPSKSQKKVKEKKNRSKSTPKTLASVLNVNASVFVPSNSVSREGVINSVAPLVAGHMQNFNIGGGEACSGVVSIQDQENACFALPAVDPMQCLNTRRETEYDGVASRERQGTHAEFLPVSYNAQDFNHAGHNINAGVSHDVYRYDEPVVNSPMDQIPNNNYIVDHQYRPVPEPVPCPDVEYLLDHDFLNNFLACESPLLRRDDWDALLNQPNPPPEFNNQAAALIGLDMSEHRPLILEPQYILPEIPEKVVFVTPEDIISKNPTTGLTLKNGENITTIKEVRETPALPGDSKNISENKPDLQPVFFNDIAGGSTVSLISERNQLLLNTHLQENRKEPVMAMPENIISEGPTTDPSLAIAQHCNNIITSKQACETPVLPGDVNGTSEKQSDPESDYSNGSTASNMLMLDNIPLPDSPIRSIVATPEDIISEGPTIDSTLPIANNVTIRREARETPVLPGDDKAKSENQPNLQPAFSNKADGVSALYLPEHCQMLDTDNELLLKNPRELIAAMPENIISKGSINDSMLTNENNNNVMNNEEKVKEHAGKCKDKSNNEEEPQKVIIQKNKRKKVRPHIDEVRSKKEHVNVVFIGHVDAGKSTIGGQLMFLTGMVDKRIMEKYKKEAKEKSRDSWYISWALDTNQEERDKGKTVETGRGHFETEMKHFTILDAPGHKSLVPSMICGAAQADIAVLVLSARQNEFETGFDKGGQTKDHAMLVKLAGVKVLIALVNKMDDPTVKWAEDRYNYCRDTTMPFLKKLGFASKDVYFMPVSGQTGDGLMSAVPEDKCPWFKGPSFIEYLNNLSPIAREFESPFVMPIVGKFKDKGTVVMGKIEAGSTHVTNNLLLMPNKVTVIVDKIWSDDKEVTLVRAGENIKLKLKGIEEEEISPGFVLCDILKPITTAKIFDAHLHILDKSIICPGFTAVMHTQCVVEEVEVTRLFCLMDYKTNVKSKIGKLNFVKTNDEVVMRMQCSGVICLTIFKEFPKLGSFTLREDNKVIAFGIVLKIIQ